MRTTALMKKGEATMNVPPEKIQQYEVDGWKIIEPVQLEAKVEPVETETADVVEPLPVPEKKSRKSRS